MGVVDRDLGGTFSMLSVPLSLKKKYQTRSGRKIVQLECALPRPDRLTDDKFPWKAWFYDEHGHRVYHWYTAYGQWSNGNGKSELDLVAMEVPEGDE